MQSNLQKHLTHFKKLENFLHKYIVIDYTIDSKNDLTRNRHNRP